MIPSLTSLTLVTGPTAFARERAIWQSIKVGTEFTHSPRDLAGSAQGTIGVLLEGLPDGKSDLELPEPGIDVRRVAPGCLCCVGNLTLRVTLNRMLRSRPRRLFISIANVTHIETIRILLRSPPYDAWLTLTADIVI
ncbi:GTPase [Glaciimonas immobilis]|nr:GTPase [Glaciimonas immobilis]